MHSSPTILRSSVVGCARKYEKSFKKGVFLVMKGSCTTFHKVNIRKSAKIQNTWLMIKKRSAPGFRHWFNSKFVHHLIPTETVRGKLN